MLATILDGFAQSVASKPDAVAVVSGTEQRTYAELDSRSNQIAAALLKSDIKPGDIVPIHLPRGIDAIDAIVGVMKSGAAFCVISTEYPADRVAYIVKDTNAKLVIDETWLANLPELSGPFTLPPMAATDPQLVVYTSGSTGTPKGVVLSRKTVESGVRSGILGRCSDDVFLSLAAFSFIALAIDVLVPLSLGAVVHIGDDVTRRDPNAIAAYIKDHDITTTFMPPQMARQLVSTVADYLRILLTGSDRVRDLYSDKMQILNVYGCSETCATVSVFPIDQPYSNATPIGQAPEGVEIYLLEDDGSLTPPGQIGEICVSGQIADGYLNLPELTAERFVPNPFATDDDHEMLFRTGDLGRFRDDGNLEFVQRKDWMIKVRGNRVEPGEIEAAMTRLAPLSQAVVTSYENAAGETALYALYTAGEKVPPEQVVDAIREFLPDYMVPSLLEQVDAIPLNQNGKIDRKNIKAPDRARFATEYVAPESERERLICKAFEEVLKIDRVGVTDRFDLLGGDSLLAAQLQTKLADFGVGIRDILEQKTPRALATVDREATTIPPAGDLPSYPLTFPERQMLAEYELDPESTAYNINIALEIDGSLDVPRLESALASLVARHAALRSYYVENAGTFEHKIADQVPVNLIVEDCPDAPARIKASDQPYDLTTPPLFRFNLYRDTSASATNRFVLNLGFHHIIMDGDSAQVIINDLWKLYDGETLPPLSIDFPDYAVFQSSHATDEAGEAFFQAMFQDGVPENEMPTHPTRPEVLPFAELDIEETLPVGPIDAAAKRLGITTYSLLVSAAALAVAKYCGSEDVTLGAAMNGRDYSQIAETVGMFVNTLAVRLKTPANQLRDDFVHEVKNTLAEVKAHQTYPFEQLVPILAPERNPSRQPVFDVIVNYLYDLPVLKTADLTIRPIPLKRQALATDFMLEWLRDKDDLRIILSYSDKLYLPQVAAGLLHQFISVLERLCADDNVLLADISEIPEPERNRILGDFIGKQTEKNAERTLVELFRAQANETPENIAVVSGDRKLTYAELDKESDRIAAHLANNYQGGTVGLLVKRDANMPLTALAVMKSGAAYLPLDPSYPSERLEYMLQDCGASVVIADPDLKDLVPGYTGDFLLTSELANLPDITPPPGPKPADTMVLLYTSGTTGKPKGVMLTHRNLVNYCTWYQENYGITAADSVPAYASFGFDANMMDMYPTLISGACLHVIPEEMRLDLPGLNDYFTQNRINLAFFTTQLGRQFVETYASVPNLRAVTVGGETLVPIQPPTDYTLYQLYGPTETTVGVTTFAVDQLYDRVPIGHAVNNTALYIVDRQGRLAPIGVAGELCIAGRQVGKGYLGRPELTAEKFVPNPFSSDPDYAVMYRTGDVARFLPDGNIDFIGRTDTQVKIRGFRVELSEIERRIREYPTIADAAVISTDAPGGGKCAVAYVVSDGTLEVPDLERFIEETLPPYMVPAATMQVAEIPLNPNGKVDRRKLPTPVFGAADEPSEAKPLSNLDLALFNVVEEVLGHRDFGITTKLTRAGLTSLSCVKLVAGIDKALGISLPVRDVMANPTILDIENLVFDRLLTGGPTQSAADVPQLATEQRDYPLTQSQMGLFYECEKQPELLVYNIPVCVSVEHADVEKLRDAITKVVSAHPGLRTRLVQRGDEIRQFAGDVQDCEPEIVHCKESEIPSLKDSFVEPFDLLNGPLFRSKICVTDQNTYLMLDFHHIVFDGFSLEIFFHDLAAAYRGESVASEAFTQFSAAQQEADNQESTEYLAAKNYFEQLLSTGDKATEIPPDKINSNAPASADSVSTSIPKEYVEDGSAAQQISIGSLFLAAVAFVTARFANSDKAAIATISSGRGSGQLQNTVGMFVKTLPLIIDVDTTSTVNQYLNEAQTSLYDVIEHESYPFTRISTDYHYNPQIVYGYQGTLMKEYDIIGPGSELERLEADAVKFPINVMVTDDGAAYTISVEYDETLFDKATMQTFADCVSNVAEQFASDRDRLLKQIPIASSRQLAPIRNFSDVAATETEKTVHQLFEEAANQNPAALAVSATDGDFDYQSLNERANAVANALIEKGAERGDRIAFMLPRNSNVFVAMYGIMKAGCAFIPIDPDYPQERIEHIISDSKARYILTEGSSPYANGIDIATLASHPNRANPNVPVTPNDLCYVIYTSGSTGKPKGVMLTHRGVINYVSLDPRNAECYEAVQQQIKVVHVITVSFDASLIAVFIPLSHGLGIVIANEEETRNALKLAKLCEATGANGIVTTPAVLTQYLEVPELREAFSKFKMFVAGGEHFPVSLYQNIRAISPGIIINAYGPTETTIACNSKVLTDEYLSQPSVGRPEHGVLEQIMDTDGNPLPIGVAGELWIGGPGVALGYYGKPELTAEKFVTWDGDTYYRSGDLAKWLANGDVQILGRNDNQIKLRGLRIELGEIEAVINACPGVKNAVVQVCEIRGQEHLCAYYVSDTGVTPKEIVAAISDKLPKYMVPTSFTAMTELPTTPNGKIDRRALPVPELLASEEYVAPESEAEEILCSVFSEVLNIQQVGANDSFFDLGGTSLAVTRVVIGAEQKGLVGENGQTIAYADVFAHPTPRELAELLGTRLENRQPPQTESEYDYAAINSLLSQNNLDSFRSGTKLDLGNVLLTGATGFLGIHLLESLLRQTTGQIVCLVRSNSVTSAEARLRSLFFYYFEDTVDWSDRIKVIEGDITNPESLAAAEKLEINTVINSAANVSHFAEDNHTHDVNTIGTENLIAFCQKTGARLVQISTVSIAGFSLGGDSDKLAELDETKLFLGQNLENQYIHSKFLAERSVLEAAANGLDAKIMRVSNLMGRKRDGEFQINANANSFLGSLRAYESVGQFPYSSYQTPVELSPIDSTADAILLLANAPDDCRVFHPYNIHNLYMGDIILAMRELGMDVNLTEDEAFKEATSAAMRDPERAERLTSLIAYQNAAQGRTAVPVKNNNEYTTQALLRLGWRWPETDEKYLKQFLKGLAELGLF